MIFIVLQCRNKVKRRKLSFQWKSHVFWTVYFLKNGKCFFCIFSFLLHFLIFPAFNFHSAQNDHSRIFINFSNFPSFLNSIFLYLSPYPSFWGIDNFFNCRKELKDPLKQFQVQKKIICSVFDLNSN